MKSIACLVVLCAPVLAAPKPPLCTSSSDDPHLVATDDAITLCVGDKGDCLLLGKTDNNRKAVPRPALAKPAAEVRDEAGKLSVCAGATCKPVGKQLAAMIGKAKQKLAAAPPDETNPTPIRLYATSDLALVGMDLNVGEGVDRIQLWSVAKDKRLSPKSPAEYKKTGERGSLMAFHVVGPTLIAEWSACAGPCSEGVLVDASGATKGTWFPAGDAVALDATRIVVIPSGASGTLTIVETKSGKHLGSLPLGDGTSAILRSAAVKLPGDDFAAFYDDGTAMKVSRFSAPAGKPPALVWTQALEACP